MLPAPSSTLWFVLVLLGVSNLGAALGIRSPTAGRSWGSVKVFVEHMVSPHDEPLRIAKSKVRHDAARVRQWKRDEGASSRDAAPAATGSAKGISRQ